MRYAAESVTGRRCLLLAVLLIAGPVASAVEKERKFLTPEELIALGENSEVLYGSTIVKDLQDVPLAQPPGALPDHKPEATTFPWVDVGKSGSRSLTTYPLSEVTKEALDKAASFVNKKEYDKALTIYESASQKDPKSYALYLRIGDSYLFSDRPSQALNAYRKATELDPYDYHVFWYQASALFALEKYAEAYASYVRALALSPGNDRVLDSVKNRAKTLSVEVHDESFRPGASARQEGDTMMVYALEPIHWWGYGMCKAVWLAEESHRIALTGKSNHSWTNTEERECLAILLAMYHARRDDGSVQREPYLDRLLEILDRGYLDSFVLYEIGGRAFPDMILLLDEPARLRIEEYVQAFVLPRLKDNEPPAPQ